MDAVQRDSSELPADSQRENLAGPAKAKGKPRGRPFVKGDSRIKQLRPAEPVPAPVTDEGVPRHLADLRAVWDEQPPTSGRQKALAKMLEEAPANFMARLDAAEAAFRKGALDLPARYLEDEASDRKEALMEEIMAEIDDPWERQARSVLQRCRDTLDDQLTNLPPGPETPAMKKFLAEIDQLLNNKPGEP